MEKDTLFAIKELEATIRSDALELYSGPYLDLLNINKDERDRIENALIKLVEKMDNIRASKIKDIHEHVDIDSLEYTVLGK